MGVRRWTADEAAVLRRLRAQGATYETIGKALGRTGNAVRCAVHHPKPPPSPADTRAKGIDKGQLKALVRDGHTDREIAAVLGVHRDTVRWHRRQLRLPANRRLRRWTAAEVDQCRRILADGGTLASAGRKVNRTPAAVREAMRRHHTTEEQTCSC